MKTNNAGGISINRIEIIMIVRFFILFLYVPTLNMSRLGIKLCLQNGRCPSRVHELVGKVLCSFNKADNKWNSVFLAFIRFDAGEDGENDVGNEDCRK